MPNKEELYVSFSPEKYKFAKLNILTAQADLLTTLKHMHNLKVLARQKRDLKIRLNKLLGSTLSELDSIKLKMPEPKIPKSIIKETEIESPTVSRIIEKKKIDYSKRDEIDKELQEIQEKLRALNR